MASVSRDNRLLSPHLPTTSVFSSGLKSKRRPETRSAMPFGPISPANLALTLAGSRRRLWSILDGRSARLTQPPVNS
ncbi:unnamed protein product, partial [Clonostachys rhizophaga]